MGGLVWCRRGGNAVPGRPPARLQSNHVPEKLCDARFVLKSEQMLLGFFSEEKPAGTRSFKQVVTVQIRSHRASAAALRWHAVTWQSLQQGDVQQVCRHFGIIKTENTFTDYQICVPTNFGTTVQYLSQSSRCSSSKRSGNRAKNHPPLTTDSMAKMWSRFLI